MKKHKVLKWLGSSLLVLVLIALAIMGLANWKLSRSLAQAHNVPRFSIHEDVLAADVELGKRIFHVRNGCVDCHGENLAGKLVVDDPAIGRFYGANLTPANLAGRTDEQIAAAIRFGVNHEGRTLIFMPSYEYKSMSKKDVAALIAYIRSVPSVEQTHPKADIGPVAKILFLLGKMPTVAPAEEVRFSEEFETKPEEGPTAEFGSYLARTACTGCHGPQLAGGPIRGGAPDWPPAADLRLGSKAGYSREKLIAALREGTSGYTGQPIKLPMPIALTKQMSETEVEALWLYLSSLK